MRASTRWSPAALAILAAFWLAPAPSALEASAPSIAQGRGHHRSGHHGSHSSRGRRGGGHHGGRGSGLGAHGAPEIDPGLLAGGAALLLGGTLVLLGGRRPRRSGLHTPTSS